MRIMVQPEHKCLRWRLTWGLHAVINAVTVFSSFNWLPCPFCFWINEVHVIWLVDCEACLLKERSAPANFKLMWLIHFGSHRQMCRSIVSWLIPTGFLKLPYEFCRRLQIAFCLTSTCSKTARFFHHVEFIFWSLVPSNLWLGNWHFNTIIGSSSQHPSTSWSPKLYRLLLVWVCAWPFCVVLRKRIAWFASC